MQNFTLKSKSTTQFGQDLHLTISGAIASKGVSQLVVSAQKLSQRDGTKTSPEVLLMSWRWFSYKLGIKGQRL